ncbi:MAG: Rieske 2Fe-2S domain-containing protein [Sphingorhabdus sp.]
MKITYLGHAGFAVETDRVIFLTDPWLSENGAFNKSWFQYPYNHHLRSELIRKIKSKDTYIYVSHRHQDHFDKEFLSDVCDSIKKFIIPEYKNRSFQNYFEDSFGKSSFIAMEDKAEIEIEDLKVVMFIDDGLINEDSAVLISDGKTNFLDLNDCKIHDRLVWIKNSFDHIDILSAQFSGATWHPHSYNYTLDQEASIANRKKLGKFRAVKKAISDLGAPVFIPSAGPATFLDPVLQELVEKEVTIFADSNEFKDFLIKAGSKVEFLKMYPGTSMIAQPDSEITVSEMDEIAQVYKNSTKSEYLEWYRKKVDIDFSELNKSGNSLDKTFYALGKLLSKRVKRAGVGRKVTQNLYIGIAEQPGHVWKVDFENLKVFETEIKPEQTAFYRVLYPASEVEKLLNGEMSWEELAITFRAKVERWPDDYNTYINAFLFVEDEKLESIVSYFREISDRAERIIIEVDGTQFEIDRFCPHQGADLKYGWAENGCWVCPRHRWEYKMEEGGLCNQAKETVYAVGLEAES